MTSAQEEQNDGSIAEPPAKRRRGGRRTMNPDISAEERKRLRVLKNRESAMRSLAKKAEYSAKLETKEREVAQECKAKRDTLEKLVATAIGLRSTLEKIPSEDVAKVVVEAEACINRASALLADEDAILPNSGDPNTAAKSQLAATDDGDDSK